VAADGAVQQAFEVVVVFAFAGAAHRPRRQQLLHGVERVVVDEGLVGAVLFDALLGDFADVGGVVQHRRDAVGVNRPAFEAVVVTGCPMAVGAPACSPT
jgi:hypothetical protein